MSFSRMGLDCILSQLGLIRPSLLTHIRSVVETLACPIITGLASKPADFLIILTLLPLGSAINRVPRIEFPLMGGS